MNATAPAEAGTEGVRTPDQHTPSGMNPRAARGTYARIIADPELVAADLLERMGPVMAGAVAAALVDLVSTTGRVIA